MKLKLFQGRGKRNKLFSQIWPVADYNEELNVFVNKDGTVFDVLRIRAGDLSAISEDDWQMNVQIFTKLYRTISNDIKIIVMNFPCSVTSQLEYLDYKAQTTRNQDVYALWYEEKKNELLHLQQYCYSREYYLIVRADDYDELSKLMLTIRTTLSYDKGLCETVSGEKKILIIKKINNKNILL